MNNHILVMTKFPRAGEVNTRMIPDIGVDKATLVHQRMAEHTIAKVEEIDDAKAIVHIANCSDTKANEWLGDTEFCFQKGSDLGERMAVALQHSFDQGADKVVVVGTDCPDLDHSLFEQAFVTLENDNIDMVYAPAEDGGYVLVGMKSLNLAAFQAIDWGTENVLDQSLKQLEKLGISYHLLKTHRDVDFAKDIPEQFLI